MPKFELKAIQKELEKGKVRPVYFLYGPERMKARELIKKIQKTALSGAEPNDFNFERIDASESGLDRILDVAQGLSMMGGTKVVLVRNAEELRNLDGLADHLIQLDHAEPVDPDSLETVLIFLSKSLDGRKKAAKTITEIAAVVPCEEVREADREAWVSHLAERRKIILRNSERNQLRSLDPWTLEIVDQELMKLELASGDEGLRSEVLLSGISAYAQEEFMDALFTRDRKRALGLMHLFAGSIDTQLPFLGLIAWNVRQMKQFLLEIETRSPAERRNPRLVENLNRWRPFWNSKAVMHFEHLLFEMDFAIKNTRHAALGLWTSLIEGVGSRSGSAG
jgi:DNA polymerase-3 subunit delta